MAKKLDALTPRQQKILYAIVREYTERAEPISSQFLEGKYDFSIRGAMIRREMQKLEALGYLSQPHTSAGRIPTEKGYRFMVDAITKDTAFDLAEDRFILSEDGEDVFSTMYHLTRKVAQESGTFTLGYLLLTQILWKEGWKEVLCQPEFANAEYISKFAGFLELLEEYLKKLNLSAPFSLNVFIGREHPFARSSEFSTLIVSCPLSPEEIGLFALAGPIRMPYKQNIRILESLPSLIRSLHPSELAGVERTNLI